MNNAAENWERFLDPDVLRPSLLSATMFITAFEVLKDCIVDRVRGFYTLGWGDKTATSHEYEQSVLVRDKKGGLCLPRWTGFASTTPLMMRILKPSLV
jgi:hypothetical protein